MRARRMTGALALMVCSAALLAGCGGGADPDSVTVTDASLGAALDDLVFQGSDLTSGDGSCLVDAVRTAGLSDEAQRYLVSTSGQEQGVVIDGLRELSEDDTAILLSADMRQSFDVCAGQYAASTDQTSPAPSDGGGATAPATEAPEAGPTTEATPEQAAPATDAPEADSPTTTPTDDSALLPGEPTPTGASDEGTAEESAPALVLQIPVPDGDITDVEQLEPGLVMTFSQFTKDETQKKTYEQAGSCLAELTLNTGFSQETLRMLAGAPVITDGDVESHLASEDDKVLWGSDEFTEGLVSCTMDVNLKNV